MSFKREKKKNRKTISPLQSIQEMLEFTAAKWVTETFKWVEQINV